MESWCPSNRFRFLNLIEGDSASAKSIEKTIYFEHLWRPGWKGDSAALNANRKTHLAQRRAILTNVFIKVCSFQGDFLFKGRLWQWGGDWDGMGLGWSFDLGRKGGQTVTTT